MHTTILDTHLHLYPCFDLTLAFDNFLDNTPMQGERVTRVACLAERFDCNYYGSIASGDILPKGFNLKEIQTNEISLTRNKDNHNLTLLPGRQIISREKIEILSPHFTSFRDGNPLTMSGKEKLNK